MATNTDGKKVDVSGMCSVFKKGWITAGSFECCPWEKFERPGPLNLLKWKTQTKNNSNIPPEEELDTVLPIKEVDTVKLDNPPSGKIQVTWIGHATVLVQFDGITVLSDPVFLDYCGPAQIASYKRYRRAACQITDILKLDAVIISHNHYDHLEKSAVKAIAERFDDVEWFVTLKQSDWLVNNGVNRERIHELDWWASEEREFNGKPFRFSCTPSQHWCARTPPLDMNTCLWCSWVIKGPTKSFYFAGDTGYYERLFKAIGDKYGPFDLAAIPIGAYEPRFITKFQHVDPEEAVKIHRDVKSKQSIAIHWGTFELTNEFFVEPPQKVKAEMQKLSKTNPQEQGLHPSKFISLCHGETWCVGDERQEPPFMTYKGEGTKSSDGKVDYTEISEAGGSNTEGAKNESCKK